MAALVLALLMAGWATRSLSAHRQRRGTLYYLRLQNETNPDYHRAAVSKAAEEYLGFRSISAWCDPGVGTVDLRREVAGMSSELERVINDDADDSGFDIAPNVIFPAALALGYDWIPPRNVTLREFNSPSRPDKSTDIQAFLWQFGCATASGHGCQDTSRRHKTVHFDSSAKAGYRLCARDQRSPSSDAASSVWLEYWLSDRDWSLVEQAMASPHKSAADVVEWFASRARR